MWWKCIGDADALDFKVDRDLSIVGVGIYPARERVPWKVGRTSSDGLMQLIAVRMSGLGANFGSVSKLLKCGAFL